MDRATAILMNALEGCRVRVRVLSGGCQPDHDRDGLRRGAEDDDFDATGIKSDISSPVHLIYAADAAERAAAFHFFWEYDGRVFWDPLAEIRYVAQCMKPEDRLLIIDGEMPDGEAKEHGVAR